MVVGAGGIACALLPSLSRLMDVFLVDADDYTPKNAERQFPALTSTGNKANVLCDHLSPHTLKKMSWEADYIRDGRITLHPEWQGVDLIVGCVDNNASRHILMDLGENYGIPVLMGGNEHAHGEAHLLIPREYDPRDHFEFADNTPPPWSCTDPETIEKNEQTPLANIMASSAILHILLSIRSSPKTRHMIVYSRLDVFSSTVKRMMDFGTLGI